MTHHELISLPYDSLFLNDVLQKGAIAAYLNENGCAHLTVCPECRVDDFIHVASCSKQKELVAFRLRLASMPAADA